MFYYPHKDLIRFPLGGLGAGMIGFTGTGSWNSVSLRHHPDLFHNPNVFSAIAVLGDNPAARVVEAQIPDVEIFANLRAGGFGTTGKSDGLPRFRNGKFYAAFPFAKLNLQDDDIPVQASVTAWSPFIPGDIDTSSYPFAALEYTFTNASSQTIKAVYSFNAFNFMKLTNAAYVSAGENYFLLGEPKSDEKPEQEGVFCAAVDEPAYVNAAWFRGDWFDAATLLWKDICEGRVKSAVHTDIEKGQSPGASLQVPFTLAPGERKTITVRLSWYVPYSNLCIGRTPISEGEPFYRPWYVSVFDSIEQANAAWKVLYASLRSRTAAFTDAFLKSTLPKEILEAVDANLSILKSPTILRQKDGRMWAWEGSGDKEGSCYGSCTHVWNYAQAICNLFPPLERTLRETEFNEMLHETGHQQFRVYLPIRRPEHDFYAAADGQLGGIIKVYRDWRISGNTEWLRSLWQKVTLSLQYCIRQWDPERRGTIRHPHHNTYDIEFWGSNGMTTGFYLGALKAYIAMGKALNEDTAEYEELYAKGRRFMEEELFNGEYFYQKTEWKDLNVPFRYEHENIEMQALLREEGPKYQYGTGCLSDGVLGVWLAELSGLIDIISEEKLTKNLRSIYTYNFKRDLSHHANPQRPGYALNQEGGLLLCTWPRGGKPSLPFVYCDEVWTGIEYQVASHLISKGFVREGLEIVKTCRARYDGRKRNPFNEYECGNWYARALASYSLLWAYTGVRYDAVDKTLYYSLKNANDYSVFLSTETGYGVVHVRGGQVKVEVVEGKIDIQNYVEV